MAIYTIYAYVSLKGTKVPIHTIDSFPHDWAEMRELLLEVARKAFNEHGVIEATYSVERHVSSRFRLWRPRIGSYSLRPFNVKREPEAYFHLIYNPNTDTITIKQATFSPKHAEMRKDYKALEKGIPIWEVESKPIVPKTTKTIFENPKMLIKEASQLRYPDYSKTFKPKYDKTTKQGIHEHTHLRTYLPWGQRIHEAKKTE